MSVLARPSRRLPGVRFESRASRLPDALPRMDIAVFVGFAAAGPLDTPVAVEDSAGFADLFGEDVVLAWDRRRCEWARANLGPAVRSFFRNGGKRCWVVRVARSRPSAGDDRNCARANRFPVAGLLRMAKNGSLRPAFAAARSEGSWSDRLAVSASLAVQGTPAAALTVLDQQIVAVRLQAPDAVAVGDLLRLRWPDGTAVLLPVNVVSNGVASVSPTRSIWVLPGPTPSGAFEASCFPSDSGPRQILTLASEPTFSADGSAEAIVVGDPPARGSWILFSRGAEQVWFSITGSQRVDSSAGPLSQGTELTGRWCRPTRAAPLPLLSVDPPPACERVRIDLSVSDGRMHPRRLSDLALAPGHRRYLGALPTDRLLFGTDDVLLSEGELSLREVLRASYGDGTDLRAFCGEFWQEVSTPRFPLALDANQTDVFLPLGMALIPDCYLGPEPTIGTSGERDGLASFSEEPFLDPALATETTLSLMARADHVRWQAPTPRRLIGIHAALGVDEATLVAVPDATHLGWSNEEVVALAPLDPPALSAVPDAQGGWQLAWNEVEPLARYVLEESDSDSFRAPVAHFLDAGSTRFSVSSSPLGTRWFRIRAYLPHANDASFWSDPVLVVNPPPQFVDCSPLGLSAPRLELAAGPDTNGSYRLAWSSVPKAPRYLLDESDAPDFSEARQVFAGSALEFTLYGRPAGRYHYRVRADGREASTSAPMALTDSQSEFDVTGVGTARHVLLARYLDTNGEETVFDGDAFTERFVAESTRVAVAGGLRYRLVRDSNWPGAPSFRAFSLEVGGSFSNGVRVSVSPPARPLLALPSEYDARAKQVLLSVQAALLRLAAARGDLLAVFGMPEHYREAAAVGHVTELRSRVPEDAAWSYGAIYHPWLLVQGKVEGGVLRAPPDGAACGVMALRAASRGAWIAPANQPLNDVLGLSPAVDREQWLRLCEAQVNVVRQEPHGFVTLSSDTLSADPDLVPINVRRLLALLRRVALRVGPTFVFEPNSAVFRRTVEREFTTLLDGMHSAGAFAGATADGSFQVAVDDSVNSPQSLDQGRFIVELKVAPSLPMSFLTLRLVQNGSVGQVTEGA